VKGYLILWTGALLFVLSVSSAPAQIDPALREQGVLYFDDNLPDKITATLQTGVTVYTHRDFQTALAGLFAGQTIELVGMSPDGYLIKGTFRNNSVTGWIRPEDLPKGIDPALLAQAQKNQQRRDAVAVAIANKTVIQGMTTDEVKQSVGRPEQIASHTDANGSSLSWIYTTYREDPQNSYSLDAFGRAILQTYYVKVPIGQLVIDFNNGVVIAVTEHKTDSTSPGIVTN